MATKLGTKAKFYRNTATYGSPTWVEITSIKDFKLNMAWDTVEAPSRASRVKSMAKTQIDISGSGSVKVTDTEAGYIALWDSLIDPDGEMDVMILNGDKATNGVRGVRYDGVITTGDEDQAIANALYMDFGVVPSAFNTNPMKTAVVASGAPVFTAI